MSTAETLTPSGNDLRALHQKLDALNARLDAMAARDRAREELIAEFMPIGKEVMGTWSEKLHTLDQRGYFKFLCALGGVVDRVVTNYGEDDVRQFGDAVVTILDTVRGMTQPEVLAVLNGVGEAVQDAPDAAPVGLYGMMKASREDDVRRGFGVMMAVLKAVGQTSAKLGRSAEGGKNRRLSKMLAPSRPRVAPARVQQAPPPAPVAAPPAPAAEVVECVVPESWDRDFAVALAAQEGLELTDQHWTLLEWARADYEAQGASPNVRRLAKGSGITTKEIYTLFPRKPGITIARVAGIPKPGGCI